MKIVCCKILSKSKRLNKFKREGVSVSVSIKKKTLKYDELKERNSGVEMFCKEKMFAETVVWKCQIKSFSEDNFFFNNFLIKF